MTRVSVQAVRTEKTADRLSNWARADSGPRCETPDAHLRIRSEEERVWWGSLEAGGQACWDTYAHGRYQVCVFAEAGTSSTLTKIPAACSLSARQIQAAMIRS